LAHTKSAKKSIRITKRRRAHNRSLRGAVKTYISKAEDLIVEKNLDVAKDAVRQASIALDKAAQKKIIHSNNAARHKSRLMKKFNSAFTAKDQKPAT